MAACVNGPNGDIVIMDALANTAAASPEKSLRPVVITVVTLKLMVAAFLLTSVQLSGPIAGSYDLASR